MRKWNDFMGAIGGLTNGGMMGEMDGLRQVQMRISYHNGSIRMPEEAGHVTGSHLLCRIRRGACHAGFAG
jgi:hypothetical protein